MGRDFESRFKARVQTRFGAEYRRLREDVLNITQEEAAQILKVSSRHYQRLEKGDASGTIFRHTTNMITLMRESYRQGFTDRKECNTEDARESFAETIVARIMRPSDD